MISDYMAAGVLNEWLRNTSFTQVATVYMSLHTADPGGTGANEVSGGSYIRKAVTFGAPTGSGHILTTSATVTFSGLPAATITHVGIWDAATAGNCYAVDPAGSGLMEFTAAAATDLLTSYGHGLAAGDRVQVGDGQGAGLPTGLVAGTPYYVIAAGLTTDVFALASTSGGSAINLTADGEGILRKVTTKAVDAGDSYEVAAGSGVFTLY